SAEAGLRLQKYGPNVLIETRRKSPWLILWDQLTAVMMIVLIIAAVISFFVGDYKDTIAILAIVVLNAILGFTQEYRAEQAMAALKRFATPVIKATRDGTTQEIPDKELVPGDVFLLEPGVLVPADGRLVEVANLKVQEAVLTGESLPVEKDTAAIHEKDITLGDRRNMVYKGTVVTYGRGLAVTTATGMQTELGRIAEMLQTVAAEPTPLQRRMAALGRSLGIIALIIVGVVLALGLLRGEDLETMFLTGVSLAVAAVPEGLPAAVTIALALGAQRMLKRRALIRKLPAVETLGLVTKICADKTGTLTENKMTVTAVVLPTEKNAEKMLTIDFTRLQTTVPASPHLVMLLTAAAMCNDAVLSPASGTLELGYVGDPTEGALVVAAARHGLRKPELQNILPRMAEVPFTSERKRMTTVHRLVEERVGGVFSTAVRLFALNPPDYFLFSKGAADSLLNVCNRFWVDDAPQTMSAAWRDRIREAAEGMSASGLRVLGIAFRPVEHLSETSTEDEVEKNLIFLGLVGMMDPPREEAEEAVETCRRAGIDPVMITGDHPLTALTVARQVKITGGQQVMTGMQLSKLTPEELGNVVEDVKIYARVAPEHKLQIVQALQRKGHIVAMTGDGVNDAPALKKADIGVAMGLTGTDVSKEAADMVLLDDNFATIVAAVEEGRVIYDNTRKFLKYLLTTNLGEITVLLVGMLTAMPIPLTPLQILWINLITDGPPALALTVEPAEHRVMRRPPPNPKLGIFAGRLGVHILWVGFLMAAIALGIGYLAWQATNPAWQTMLFTTLSFSQLAHVLAIRSGRTSLFKAGLLSNKTLLAAVSMAVAMQLAVVYVPWLQGAFRTIPLNLNEILTCIALASIIFWAVEIEKWFVRRGSEV
ncbi:MAG: cation-translocating P-type ATPase, partial [Ammonifex sp.]